MLQRIQTLYLFGALIVNFVFLFAPIGISTDTSVSVTSNISVTILNLSLNGLLLFSIFSFKNRKRQVLICALLGVGFMVEMGISMMLLTDGVIAWNFCLPFASILLNMLALRAINRDEKLVRSADRLR